MNQGSYSINVPTYRVKREQKVTGVLGGSVTVTETIE